MTKGHKGTTPAGLGRDGRALYRQMMDEYAIDDSAGRALLLNAAQQADRIADARAAIDQDGLFLTDRAGRQYAHPAVQIEMSASKALLAALRGLRLAPTGVA